MSGPLAGIVVTDLSRALAGPHAAMMLGDLGARVIKVERPDGGDDSRGWGPPFVGPEGGRESTYFFSCNRNKESVTADLASPDGADLLTRLIRRSDVLVENFRTGVLDRLGFGMDRLHEINPRLVVLSITGFGHDGPQGGRAGYDQIAQGEAGIMSLTGTGPDDPQRVGVPIADILAGMYGAYGVLAALLERDRTGRGDVVRTSLLAATVGAHAYHGPRYTVAGEVSHGQGNHHPSIAPYGAFACADGIVQIAVGSPALWRSFAGLVGLDPADPRFATNIDRVRHRDALVAAIEGAFAGHDLTHWLPALAAVGVPAGEVRSLDRVYDWDQTRSQDLLIEVDHATAGPLRLPGVPLRFDAGGPRTHRAPPTLGQHDAAVRAWLDESEPASRSAGVVPIETGTPRPAARVRPGGPTHHREENPMPTRTARTSWTGGLQDGAGTVELTSSGVGSYDVSFPKRAADDAGGTTSPEELIAAAHSSCYAMQLSAMIAEAGGTPKTLEVTADVSLRPDPAGGFRISGIALDVRGEVEGLDEAAFSQAAEAAKSGCPVSKALTGTTITLSAALR